MIVIFLHVRIETVGMGLICPMKAELLMPSTLGVVMVVKKIAVCFVKIINKYCYSNLFIH